VNCKALLYVSLYFPLFPASALLAIFVDRLPGADVGDDAPHVVVQVRFVQPNPHGQVRLVAFILGLDMGRGDVPDGLLVATKVLRDALEGVDQALLADVCDAAQRHPALAVDSLEGWHEQASALPATVSLNLCMDAGRLADGRVEDGDVARTMLVERGIHDAARLANVRLLGVRRMDDHALVCLIDVGRRPAGESQDVGHRAASYKAHATIAMPKENTILVGQVSILKGDAVRVKECVRVPAPDFAVESDGLGPVGWLVLLDVPPLFLGMVRTIPARASRRRRPTHALHQRLAVAPVHTPLNQWVPVPPLGSAGLHAMLLVRTDADPDVGRRAALSRRPTSHNASLPLVRAVGRQLANLAALVGKYGHEQRFPVSAPIEVNCREIAFLHPVQDESNLGQLRGDYLVHVLPGRGLLPFGINDYGKVRANLAQHDKSSNRRRLHPATRRPNLSSRHVFPNPFQPLIPDTRFSLHYHSLT